MEQEKKDDIPVTITGPNGLHVETSTGDLEKLNQKLSGVGLSSENSEQPDLPGMPEKETETIMAEEIVDVKEEIKDMKEKLDYMKTRLINEMRVKQVSFIKVKGFEFHLDIKDDLKIKKEKQQR